MWHMAISTKQSYMLWWINITISSQPRGLGEYAQSALLKTETGAVQCGARGLEVMIVMVLVFYI